jgi:two-component system chemotaxis response regulator CheV
MTADTNIHNKILLETGTNELEIITFFLRWYDAKRKKYVNTYYGINAAKVSELIAVPEEITHTPNSPESVKGVFMLREKTIPLIDICNWFQYDPDVSEEAKKKWTVIVTELNGKFFGFLSHGVDKVYRTSWTSILPPHELIASSNSLTGMVLIENNLIQMIDFENITASIDPGLKMKLLDEASGHENVFADSGKVVVIADDSRVIRDLLKNVLETANFAVVEHSDGLMCWDYLQEIKKQGPAHNKILAIISDIEMPQMDGHNLCLRIKEDSAFDKIPVILFSSMINDALHKKGVKVGADAQITKPELNRLVQTTIDLIAKYQG